MVFSNKGDFHVHSKMDNSQDNQEYFSQYPDPEQSGLSFPWLDQYQPVAAERFSARQQPIIHEGFVPQDDASSPKSGYGLRSRHKSSIMLAEEGLLTPHAVLEDSEEDPDFVETDNEAA